MYPISGSYMVGYGQQNISTTGNQQTSNNPNPYFQYAPQSHPHSTGYEYYPEQIPYDNKYYMRDNIENKHFSQPMNMGVNMGIGLATNPNLPNNMPTNINGMNPNIGGINPGLSGMNPSINPSMNPNINPNMNPHMNPNVGHNMNISIRRNKDNGKDKEHIM